MKHVASPAFWEHYRQLPPEIRDIADKNFELLKEAPNHPSLHFKKVGRYWSARVGRKYRALAVEVPGGILWFWIGPHKEYEKLIK